MQVIIKRHNHDLDEALKYYKEVGVDVEWYLNPFAAGVIVFFEDIESTKIKKNVLTLYLEKGGEIGIVCDNDMEIEMWGTNNEQRLDRK